MKRILLLLPCVLLGSTSCSTVTRLNCMINQSTQSIYANQEAVDRSTEVIRKNARLIEESNRAIEENRRLLESMSKG